MAAAADGAKITIKTISYDSSSNPSRTIGISGFTDQLNERYSTLATRCTTLKGNQKVNCLRWSTDRLSAACAEMSSMNEGGCSLSDMKLRMQYHLSCMDELEKTFFRDAQPDTENVFSFMLQAAKSAVSSFSSSANRVKPTPAPQEKAEGKKSTGQDALKAVENAINLAAPPPPN